MAPEKGPFKRFFDFGVRSRLFNAAGIHMPKADLAELHAKIRKVAVADGYLGIRHQQLIQRGHEAAEQGGRRHESD
jgi:hypothetical protein